MYDYNAQYEQPSNPNAQSVDVRDLQYFDYKNPMVKDDFGWWANPEHKGVQEHREKSKYTHWYFGRRVSDDAAACSKSSDCFYGGIKCDVGDGNISRQCVTYEPNLVQCWRDPKDKKGVCVVNT